MKEIAYMLTFRLVILIIAFGISVIFSSVAQAQLTTPTPAQVGAINNVGKIIEANAYVFSDNTSGFQTVIFSITFSLRAFGRDMEIPLSLAREKGVVIADDTIGYTIMDREKNIIKTGYEAAFLLQHEPQTSSEHALLRLGEPQKFTLIVAYSDKSVIDREDRMFISTLPLTALDGKIIDLNPSELQDLKTGFISLES